MSLKLMILTMINRIKMAAMMMLTWMIKLMMRTIGTPGVIEGWAAGRREGYRVGLGVLSCSAEKNLDSTADLIPEIKK